MEKVSKICGTCHKLEVNKDDSVEKAVKKILVHEGRIDVLINNAGYGIVGALENISVKMMQELMNINLFGSIRCIQKVLPNMRMKGGSSIVNISSVSGVVASPFLGAYCSSKFALEGLTESLSLELAKYNIRVILIEPGLIKSEFFKNSTVVNSAKNNAYFKDVSAYVKFIKNLIETEKAQDPIETANAILSIIFSNKPGLRKQTNQWSKKIVSTKLKNEIINK